MNESQMKGIAMGKIKWNNKKTNILLLGILGVGLLVGALFFWIEYPRMKEFGRKPRN